MDLFTYPCSNPQTGLSNLCQKKWPLDYQAYLINFSQYSVGLPKHHIFGIDSLHLNVPTLQYIPRNMHTVLLCFALLWLCNRS